MKSTLNCSQSCPTESDHYTNPGISVLMTTYNRERYVEKAIRSVLASTFADFELVVVDDGSKDHTVSIVQQLAAEDSRITLHRNLLNLGDYPNRNRAASFAKGKYLKYVDADDLIYPWGLQILWDCMEKYPDAGWGLCSLAQDRQRIFPFVLAPAEAYRYHYLGPGLFHKAPLSSIIRKPLFDEVGGFQPFSHAGDFAMWHKLALHSPVVCMNQGIVWYREHDDQSSNTQHLHADQYITVEQNYLSSPDCPLTKHELRTVYRKKKADLSKSRIIHLLRRNFKAAYTAHQQLRALKSFTS
jgi:glycosyltransferase involved in cell wall biosynthesis